MTTIALKLPESLAQRLKKEARSRKTTTTRVARECLEAHLPGGMAASEELPELPPGESFYDRALPILEKAWARKRKRGPRDLATNPKYMEGYGK